MKNEKFTKKNIDLKTLRLRDILISHRMSNTYLCKELKIPPHSISKLMTGNYMTIDIGLLTKIANYFNVGINDIYETDCKVDENNRIKLMVLNTVLKDIKILSKLKKLFTKEEKMYLTEMLKSYEYNNPGVPKKFLINIILEADYYTDIQVKYKVKASNLSDKIDDLNELEAFVLLNSLLDYNNTNEDNIEKLFYLENKIEKFEKRKKSNHL